MATIFADLTEEQTVILSDDSFGGSSSQVRFKLKNLLLLDGLNLDFLLVGCRSQRARRREIVGDAHFHERSQCRVEIPCCRSETGRVMSSQQ